VEGSFTRKRNYRSVGNKRTKRNGLKAQSSNESQLGNKCLNTEHQCSQYFRNQSQQPHSLKRALKAWSI